MQVGILLIYIDCGACLLFRAAAAAAVLVVVVLAVSISRVVWDSWCEARYCLCRTVP